ncbi:MAG TPA: GDSL-type esterase/lipase family protein [Candidatus Methylacidiphilales bacterium]
MVRRLFFPVLILLAGLVILNVFAFFQVRHFYEARLLEQLWPLGPPAPRLRIPATDETTVLLYGDSRIVDWESPELHAGPVVNGGGNGLTTGQLALRLPAWLEACHPKIVVLEAGVNVIKIIGLRPDLYQAVLSQSLSNFNLMFEECRQHHAQVILLPVWPTNKISFLRRLVWNPAADRAVPDLNHQLMQAVAGRRDAVWLDLLSPLLHATPENDREQIYRDDLHFNKSVYRQLTPLLDQALATSFPGR